MENIELPYCTISFINPVITMVIKEEAMVDAPEMLELIKVLDKVADYKPYCILTKPQVFFTITPEARKIIADKKQTSLVKANAIIVNNLPLRLLSNFFANFNKPHFKFKVFTDERKAEKWLRIIMSE